MIVQSSGFRSNYKAVWRPEAKLDGMTTQKAAQETVIARHSANARPHGPPPVCSNKTDNPFLPVAERMPARSVSNDSYGRGAEHPVPRPRPVTAAHTRRPPVAETVGTCVMVDYDPSVFRRSCPPPQLGRAHGVPRTVASGFVSGTSLTGCSVLGAATTIPDYSTSNGHTAPPQSRLSASLPSRPRSSGYVMNTGRTMAFEGPHERMERRRDHGFAPPSCPKIPPEFRGQESGFAKSWAVAGMQSRG
ncbi:hypothetical protein J8273_0198 [Carpediemonas membranifera]|uniref:Uncharacterized protein n=1 Tax=Carpediemonas membranifera TaxID=201153 RepID=A0A8J6EAP1_9EUKA|nr:hypothetical protein J8273_0198 [Carpediemonas membranifera]|eukprot:KAG9394990.1 hypothetical protein J8273_0198 [Carpediemonas membranifera]